MQGQRWSVARAGLGDTGAILKASIFLWRLALDVACCFRSRAGVRVCGLGGSLSLDPDIPRLPLQRGRHAHHDAGRPSWSFLQVAVTECVPTGC